MITKKRIETVQYSSYSVIRSKILKEIKEKREEINKKNNFLFLISSSAMKFFCLETK